MPEWVLLNSVTALLMPGTQAQNVMWVALDEQLAPARTGVLLGLALALVLALALALELELELALETGVVLDELDPPLLQAASSVSAAATASPVRASRFFLSLSDLPFDNIWGTPSFTCCRVLPSLRDGRERRHSRPAGEGSATDRRLNEGERLRWKCQDDGAVLGCL
jgi:hypothetical protein